MVRKFCRAFRPVVLLSLSLPAAAQSAATPPPSASAVGPPGMQSEGLTISAQKGQTQSQQWSDRYECHRWAKSQSGFDPTQPGTGTPGGTSEGRDHYRRAYAACLEGRGYAVQYGAPAAPTVAAHSASALHLVPVALDIKYRPLTFRVDGGYTITTGSTDRLLHDGGNVGLGLTWFPASTLPLGVRVDGSYSSFRARRNTLGDLNDSSGSSFTVGHEDVYGADVDLQLDLAHDPSRSKFYLFGGAGWYRERTRLQQISFEQGSFCGFYFCGPGLVPIVTAEDRSTSSWHGAWNAGLGWEVFNADGASFFVEARYLRIAPHDSQMQFVPIRLGLRF